jgi:hypothetical protein
MNNINKMETQINDFNKIITLNARGDKIEIYEHHLMKSAYFRCLIGNPQSMEYYVDCDKDVMLNLIAYMETNFTKNNINDDYFKFYLDKFCIEYNSNEKDKKIENTKNIKKYLNPNDYTIELLKNKIIDVIDYAIYKYFDYYYRQYLRVYFDKNRNYDKRDVEVEKCDHLNNIYLNYYPHHIPLIESLIKHKPNVRLLIESLIKKYDMLHFEIALEHAYIEITINVK